MYSVTRIIRFLRRGVGISDTDVEYADSTNSIEAPTTGWQTTAPKWQNGHFIWSRTHITYTDGSDKYTEPVCLPSGKGIDRIVEQYFSSTSSTALEGVGGWTAIAPPWVDGRFIWTRSVIYYTDGTSQTTDPVCTTGSKGSQGKPGEDAISVQASLTSIVHHKSSSAATYRSDINMFKGTTPVSFTIQSVAKPTGTLVSYTQSGTTQMLNVTISAGSVVNGNINVTLSYDGKTYPLTISVATVSDGEQGHKGEVGATMRGPQSWSDLGVGYTFESGGEGDEWKDVVIYGSTYYSCIKNHVKTATNYPGSDEDDNNQYWRAGSPVEIIATRILLSEFAFFDNLGAKAVRMYSEDGKELLFEAYKGELTCKTGAFENVSVSGDICVGTLRYSCNTVRDGVSVINGTFIQGGGTYVLPHLSDGEVMRIIVFDPIITRSTPPATLVGEQTEDVFLAAGNSFLLQRESEISVENWCELIGSNYNGHTLWMYHDIKNS